MRVLIINTSEKIVVESMAIHLGAHRHLESKPI